MALDILQSGAVSENPNYSRHLARIALTMLQEPFLADETVEGPPVHLRLVAAYDDFLKTVYREDLDLRVGQTDVDRTAGAWLVVLHLCRRGIAWAQELFDRHWPASPSDWVRLPSAIAEAVYLPEGRRRVEEALPTLPPAMTRLLLRFVRRVEGPSGLLGALVALGNVDFAEVEIRIHVEGVEHHGCRIRAISLRQERPDVRKMYLEFSRMRDPHPGWVPLTLVNALLESPNHGTLARILDECADRGWTSAVDVNTLGLPWPLRIPLEAAKSADDLRGAARRLRASPENGRIDWIAYEEGWSSEGTTLDRLVETSREADGLASLFDASCIPHSPLWSFAHGAYSHAAMRALSDAAMRSSPGWCKEALTWFVTLAGKYGDLTGVLSPSELQTLVEEAGSERAWWQQNCIKCPQDQQRQREWLEFYDWLGRSNTLSQYYPLADGLGHDEEWLPVFQQAFVGRAVGAGEPLGLLRLLGRLASVGKTMETVPPSMLNRRDFCDPRSKFAALLVRIAQGKMTSEEGGDAARDAAVLLAAPAEKEAERILFSAIEAHLARMGSPTDFLLSLRDAVNGGGPLPVAHCERLLRQIARTRPSSVQAQGQLEKLDLPILPESAG